MIKDCINSFEAVLLIAFGVSLLVGLVLVVCNLIMIRRKVNLMSQQSDRIEAAAVRLAAAAVAIKALIESLKANQRDPAEVASLDASGARLDQTVADFESLIPAAPTGGGGGSQAQSPSARPTNNEPVTIAKGGEQVQQGGESGTGADHSFLVEGGK